MYIKFFGLREEPFRLTPDPSFLHLAEPHRAVLIALIEAVVYRRGFLVISGPIGTGKTTLLHTAMRILTQKFTGNQRVETAFLVNPTLTRDEFLESVLDEFEVKCPSSTKPRRLAALHEHLLETQRRGGTAVLIVDEAHLLTVELAEEIRLLSNLEGPMEKMLQIVLAGQPELEQLIASPQLNALRQRIVDHKTLRALNLPELRMYVVERMKVAGWNGPLPFLNPALEEIYRCSQGIPRIINLLCDSCLWLAFHADKTEISAGIAEEAATLHLGMGATSCDAGLLPTSRQSRHLSTGER
jgi:general secretion pathway protein A